MWDSLGYYRVRTLANDQTQHDADRLMRYLEVERPRNPGPDRDLIDAAIKALHHYRKLRRRSSDTDDELYIRTELDWDRILGLVDQYLERRQRRHLHDVRRPAHRALTSRPVMTWHSSKSQIGPVTPSLRPEIRGLPTRRQVRSPPDGPDNAPTGVLGQPRWLSVSVVLGWPR